MWTKVRRIGGRERGKEMLGERSSKIRNKGGRSKECEGEETGLGRSERGTSETGMWTERMITEKLSRRNLYRHTSSESKTCKKEEKGAWTERMEKEKGLSRRGNN